MSQIEGQRLAEFSRAVRESTLKRLVQVPTGKECWSPVQGAMSFMDIAHHIAEADGWLFQKLKDPALSKMTGNGGEAARMKPAGFQALVTSLRRLGEQRADLLSTLVDSYLDSPMFDDRFGNVTVWWVIVRGNLDHEAHHRGQMAVYLKLMQSK